MTIERVDSMIVDIRGHSDLLRFIQGREEDKVKPSENFEWGRERLFQPPNGCFCRPHTPRPFGPSFPNAMFSVHR